MFRYIENVFSESTLLALQPICVLDPTTDLSTYKMWPDAATEKKTLQECFTVQVRGQQRIKIIQDLYSNSILYHPKLKQADFAIHKLPLGGSIPKHKDKCIMSLTVFLSDDFGGGEFVSDEGVFKPKFNCGVYAIFNSHMLGTSHEIMPVTNGNTRYTLQMFIWDKSKKDVGAQF